MPGRFRRTGRKRRAEIPFTINGEPSIGYDGDTLLVAVLSNRRFLRRSEFGDGNRSGFCLMGACQDCWICLEDGRSIRACTNRLQPGMAVVLQDSADD